MQVPIKPAGEKFDPARGWKEGMMVFPICARGKAFYGEGPFLLGLDCQRLGFWWEYPDTKRREFFRGDSGDFAQCLPPTSMGDFL